MLNKAHDTATIKGAPIIIKRVSIIDNPFEIFKLITLYIIIKNILNLKRKSSKISSIY